MRQIKIFLELTLEQIQGHLCKSKSPLSFQACLDSGFFYVVDHGISQEFMDEVFSQSKKFFDLPIKEKMKVLRNEKNRGYTPLLDEILDPDNQVHGNCRCSLLRFHLFVELCCTFFDTGEDIDEISVMNWKC